MGFSVNVLIVGVVIGVVICVLIGVVMVYGIKIYDSNSRYVYIATAVICFICWKIC